MCVCGGGGGGAGITLPIGTESDCVILYGYNHASMI